MPYKVYINHNKYGNLRYLKRPQNVNWVAINRLIRHHDPNYFAESYQSVHLVNHLNLCFFFFYPVNRPIMN